jgi:DNA-directed RNA polymerase subunit RPC12/RpoP
MSDSKARISRFDCFACGRLIQSSKTPGAMIKCPGCGVKLPVSGRPDGTVTVPVPPKWAAPSPGVPPYSAIAPTQSPIGGGPPRRSILGRTVVVAALLMVAGTIVFMIATHVPPVPPPESGDVADKLAVASRESSAPPGGDAPDRPAVGTETAPVDRVLADTSKPRRLPGTKPAPADRLAAFRYPKSADEIRSTLREILEEPTPPGMTPERGAGLRRLRAYRYLCGVPYRSVNLDKHLNEMATAAADICRRLGYLDHHPMNPRLPVEVYQRAYRATTSSNLSMGRASLATAVDAWIDDSSESNLPMVGHRRWCLNPSMGNTGMGRVDQFSAMWNLDRATIPFEDYTFIGFPCPGLMPVDFCPERTPWSITVNPRDFRTPRGDRVKVRLYRVESDAIDRAHPMDLDFFNVDTDGYGVPNCIIFRPRSIEVEDGRRYWVEVDHLERAEGAPAHLEYLVEFIR